MDACEQCMRFYGSSPCFHVYYDQVVANETKVVVQREEEEAGKKAAETQAIADDAQRDLDEALPALVRHYSSYFHYFINQTAKQSIFQGARVRVLRERACEAKEKKNFSRLFPDSLFVLTLAPPSPQYFCLTTPAFFHYEKIRAVLQSIHFFRRLKV